MAKPTAYIETTVIGHLVGRMLADPIVAGRQTVTRQWWPTAIAKYRFFVSKVVADECAAGDPDAAKERLEVLDALEFIATSPSVNELVHKLIDGFAVPKTERAHDRFRQGFLILILCRRWRKPSYRCWRRFQNAARSCVSLRSSATSCNKGSKC